MNRHALPFAVVLAVPARPLDGPVRVVLTPQKEPTGDVMEAADYEGALGLLQLFAQAVNAQIFSRDPAQPAQLEVDSVGWNDAAGVCELEAQARHLPAYAWAHLLAMLQKNHEAYEELARVVIESPGVSAPISLPTLLGEVPQDLCDRDVGFIWSTAGSEKFRNIRLDVEFQDEIGAATLEALEQDLSAWMQMVILGAFDLDFSPADDLDPLGTFKVTSPYRAECFVPYFQGDMSGMVALENLLQGTHRHRQAIAEAILE